jgi:PemK-like, MazF-like toxin of type II toxin-antitoxin system
MNFTTDCSAMLGSAASASFLKRLRDLTCDLSPAIVIQRQAKLTRNRVQVVPLTSNLKRVYAWETRVEVKGQSRKALADQIRTAAKERLSSRAGSHSLADLRG